MTLGTGIFLSSVFLGLIGLYIATKDRWNWKKICKRVSVTLSILLVGGGLSLWAYISYVDRVVPVREFWGLTTGTPAAEVKFRKGVPTKEDQSTDANRRLWIYKDEDKGWYLVSFQNDKIRWIGYSGEPYRGPSIKGIYKSATIDSIKEIYGDPSYISHSKDGLNRLLNFAKFNIFVELNANGVSLYGIYDPATSPLKFADSKE